MRYPHAMRDLTVHQIRNTPELVAELIEETGVSKRSLAVFLRCEPKVIRSWEKGKHKPDEIRALMLSSVHRVGVRMGPAKFSARFEALVHEHKSGALEWALERGLEKCLSTYTPAEIRATTGAALAIDGTIEKAAIPIIGGAAGGLIAIAFGKLLWLGGSDEAPPPSPGAVEAWGRLDDAQREAVIESFVDYMAVGPA